MASHKRLPSSSENNTHYIYHAQIRNLASKRLGFQTRRLTLHEDGPPRWRLQEGKPIRVTKVARHKIRCEVFTWRSWTQSTTMTTISSGRKMLLKGVVIVETSNITNKAFASTSTTPHPLSTHRNSPPPTPLTTNGLHTVDALRMFGLYRNYATPALSMNRLYTPHMCGHHATTHPVDPLTLVIFFWRSQGRS